MPKDFELLTVKGVRFIILNLSCATIKEAIILRSIIEEEIVTGVKKLVLDISHCEFIDSSFIGSIVVEQKKMKENGGEIMLVEPVNLDKDLFHVINTLRLFEINNQKREKVVENKVKFKPSSDSIKIIRHPVF